MTEVVIVEAVRSAIGRRNGGLSTVHPADLLATVLAEVVARWTGIPVAKLMQGELEKLVHLESHLHERVVGQERAVVPLQRLLLPHHVAGSEMPTAGSWFGYEHRARLRQLGVPTIIVDRHPRPGEGSSGSPWLPLWHLERLTYRFGRCTPREHVRCAGRAPLASLRHE